MDFVFWLSFAAFAVTLAIVADALLGWRQLARLADIAPLAGDSLPSLSIVVPARNEAHTIEPAMRSLLSLDYPGLEVVAIDDRSNDATGEILDRLARERRGLHVVHIRELPSGWLGKTHAMAQGAAGARGEYLLFTDADVHYEPSALRRAIAFCRERRLDHLTVLPDIPARSLVMQIAMVGGLLSLLAMSRPWRARHTGRHGLGIGAFNLVRAEAYRRAGGHAAIAMEVVDDLALGRLMGDFGRQDFAFAMGLMSVEIYPSFVATLKGMQKNVFAFLEYSPWILLAATAGTLAVSVWPWVGVLATEGATRWINVATVTAAAALHAHAARQMGYRPACVVYLPFAGAVSVLLFWQVAIRTWVQGGVVWRGTFYRLAELKAARRRRRPELRR